MTGTGPETGSAPPPLPPLPQYTCGSCHQEFGSNCDPDDIMCAWCEAQRCPHCHAWFGGEEGVVSPDPGRVTVTRDQLADALTRLDVSVLTSGPAAGMINADSMAGAILEALAAAEVTG
jgi:hypothetical protein